MAFSMLLVFNKFYPHPAATIHPKNLKAVIIISRLNAKQANFRSEPSQKESKMRMMSTSIIVTIVLLISLCDAAPAQTRGFGTGMILGEPTGISFKNWLSYSKAIDFAVAWSFEGNNSLTLHADYLNHNFRLIKVDKGSLPFYYGIGARIKFGDDNKPGNDETRFGARVPLGLTYLFENITLDLFVEIVPILDLVPETDFRLNAAVGIRFFFK